MFPLGLKGCRVCACTLALFAGHFAAAAPILPDLTVESRSRFNSVDQQGVRRLYFTTYSINQGPGPLELRGATIHGGTQDVYQRVYDMNGSFTDHYAGTFVYHAQHDHIHFEDYAVYNLREITANNGVGGIVAASEKISFCLLDVRKMDAPPPNTPASAQYVSCESFQGISVGWIDVYDWSLPGQSIVINGVSGGEYWLELEIDPDNRLIEANENNNIARDTVTLPSGFSPEINVTGNGQTIVSGDTTPDANDHTDFGFTSISNGTVTRTFTIQNSGNGTLSLTGVPRVEVQGDGDFTVTALPESPVAPAGAQTFQVTFDPSTTGTRSAIVRIVNNDSNEGIYQFAVRGNLDADQDGMADGWESLHSVSDPGDDADGDGEDNLSEFVAGTNPHSTASVQRSGRALNLSTRLFVNTGDAVGIAGFIITGSSPRSIALRGLGPSLSSSLANFLPDPLLELRNLAGDLLASNDDWASDPQAGQITALQLAPTHQSEAALYQSLAPGTYTAIIRGHGQSNGVGLVELYDVTQASDSRLANLSTRAFVQTEDFVVIGGVILGGGAGVNQSGTTMLMVRGLGPSLAQSNVPNVLNDPTVELRDQNGALIAFNDNWKEQQQAAIEQTQLAPPRDAESALLVVLPKGRFTAILRGKNGTTGIGLVELYHLP